MKKLLGLTVVLFLVFPFLGPVRSACAQRRVPYSVTTPPMSPYMQFSRQDTGGQPSFYSFVRPAQQFRTFSQRQNAANYFQNRQMQAQQERIDLLQQQFELRSSNSLLMPGNQISVNNRARTSRWQAARFLYLSNFYPQPQPGTGAGQRR